MIALLLAVSLAIAGDPQKICVKEVITQKEVCHEERHPILGAGAGYFILGPLGAVAGAIAGSNPTRKCEIVEEKVCVEYGVKTK